MKTSNNFITIKDAYQLAAGAKIRATKNPEETFVLHGYDADKKGYMVYPFDEGKEFDDFGVLVTESELMDDYEIEELDVTKAEIA